MTRFLKKRRALSPAITTLILLGVAIAGGVTVLTVFNSQSSVAAVKGAITIESMSLIKNSSGETWLSVTIKNAGNKEIDTSAVNLQVDTDTGTAGLQPFTVNPTPQVLNPAQTASIFTRVDDSGGSPLTGLNLGQNIPVEILGTTPDGSTISVPSSVTVGLA